MPTWKRNPLLLIVFSLAMLAGCATTPPKHVDNICKIFEEKGSWYKHAKRASQDWGISIPINMAFMHQESRFVPYAKPPRKKILGFIPGPRKSSAYGYSQAKKETWRWYQEKSGHRGADRDDFDDAIDFVAWYNQVSVQTARISATDAYNLYLAYHEGHGGFTRGTYKKKAWLKKVARKVAKKAATYETQLKKCEANLNSSWWPF